MKSSPKKKPYTLKSGKLDNFNLGDEVLLSDAELAILKKDESLELEPKAAKAVSADKR